MECLIFTFASCVCIMAEAANAGAGAAESDDLAGKPIPFDPSAKPAKGILRKAGRCVAGNISCDIK